jgi:hypothetical protein
MYSLFTLTSSVLLKRQNFNKVFLVIPVLRGWLLYVDLLLECCREKGRGAMRERTGSYISLVSLGRGCMEGAT